MDETLFQSSPSEKHLLDKQWQVPSPPLLNVPDGSTLVEAVSTRQLPSQHSSERSCVQEEGQYYSSEREQLCTNGDACVIKAQGQRSKGCSFSGNFKESARSMLMDVAEELTRLASDREMELRQHLNEHQEEYSHITGGSDFDTTAATTGRRKSFRRKITDSHSNGVCDDRFSSAGSMTQRASLVKRNSSKQQGLTVASAQKKEYYNYKGLLKILQEGDDRQDSNRFRAGNKKSTMMTQEFNSVPRSLTAWSVASAASSLGWSGWEYMKDSIRRVRQRKENMEIVLDQAMGVVIILNTITIGMSCDIAEDSSGWLILDSVYACLFLAETIAKVRILGCRVFCCGLNWAWNWLETVLVVLAWAEIGIQIVNASGDSDVNVSMIRTVRIVRISRIVRVCRLPFMTDLVMMINGAIGGWKTLVWSILLITLPLYVVALLMRETLGRDSSSVVRDSFSSVPTSTFTLFRCIVAGDCTNKDGVPIFLYTGSLYSVVYMITMLLMTFGLFNVIVAIYVENTVAAAKYNELHQKRQRLRDNLVFARKACDLVETVWQIFCEVQPVEFGDTASAVERLGADPHAIEIVSEIGNFTISLEFFEILKHRPEFQELLKDMDIADNDTMDLFETLDVDGSGTIDLAELLFGLRKLRGDPRRADVIANNLITRSILHECSSIEAIVKERRAEEKSLIALLKQLLETYEHPKHIMAPRQETRPHDIS